MARLETEFVTDFDALEALAGDWDRLWRADPGRSIFGHFGWARASWRAYGSERKLCTLVVRDGLQICGLLPLAGDGATLRFLTAPRADYNDMFTDPASGADLAGALRILPRAPVTWSTCILSNLPESSALVRRFTQQKKVWGVFSHLAFASHCPRVELGADRDATLAAILNKTSLRRRQRKLARLGEISFRHIEDREEARAHLPRFFEQHIARWSRAGKPSLFQDPAARAFYNELLHEFDLRRELRFGVLEVGGRPASYHFGFEMNGVFFWYKPTFDVQLWDYSPGEVLIKKLFEYVRDTRLTRFDFTVGDERFKSRYANHIARNFTLRIFPFGAQGMARYLAASGWFSRRSAINQSQSVRS